MNVNGQLIPLGGPNTPILASNQNSNFSQKFAIMPCNEPGPTDSTGYYFIVDAASGMFLSAQDAGTGDATLVHEWPYEPSPCKRRLAEMAIRSGR